MKFSGVITIGKRDVHAKGPCQMPAFLDYNSSLDSYEMVYKD